uniref:Uncharacterized protein n=1 Tax=Pyrodinium bahamense TaxID=73915 RepID=A0A7S0A465_9DINO
MAGSATHERLASRIGTAVLDHIVRVEEQKLRQQALVYINSSLPSILLYLMLALQPFDRLAHLRWAMLIVGTLTCINAMVTKIAVRGGEAGVEHRVELAEHTCLVVRLVSHLTCITFDGDSTHTFLKLVSLCIHPLSSAKESNSPHSFKMYLVLHNLLVLLRFWNNLEGGAPWIVWTLVMDRMLLDWVHAKSEQMQTREELAVAHVELGELAEATTKKLFERFCDCTATLTDDFRIDEPAPQLAAMLGLQERQMVGRAFCSLLDFADLKCFLDHMELVAKEADARPDERVHSESIQVNLLDVYAQPVSVHIFSACFHDLDKKPTFYVGMSETWRPSRSRSKRQMHSHTVALRTAAVEQPKCSAKLQDGRLTPPEARIRARSTGAYEAHGALAVSGSSRMRNYSPRPSCVRRTSSTVCHEVQG